MSRSLNKVMLIGNLTKDPNLRYTPTGTAVCSFVVATNRDWVSAEGGDKQTQVEYTSIVTWSKLAEVMGKLLSKGAKVYVEGRLQSREWKKDDGTTTRIVEVIAETVLLLKSGSGQPGADQDGYTAPSQNSAPTKASTSQSSYADNSVTEAEDITDDIPF